MREIFAFIEKEFKHIFRDRRTTLIVLVMPVVQIVLFGFAISTEVHNAVVDVVGDVSDPLVSEVLLRIDKN
ncbi:MAG: ABC transporter permease, partial [Candidatus Cryptobacteroides sp.]